CRAVFFFFSSRRRHTISKRDWSSDVCSSDLQRVFLGGWEHVQDAAAYGHVAAFFHEVDTDVSGVAQRGDGLLQGSFVPGADTDRSEERRVGKECSAGSVCRQKRQKTNVRKKD